MYWKLHDIVGVGYRYLYGRLFIERSICAIMDLRLCKKVDSNAP